MAPLVLVQTRKFGALDVPQKPKPAPKPAPKPVEDEDLNAKSFSFLGGLVASSMFDADADATPPPPATTTASTLLQRCANGDAAADALAEASYWRAFEAPSARRAPAATFDAAAARAARRRRRLLRRATPTPPSGATARTSSEPDWYDLDGGALPDAFFDLLGAERPRSGDAAAAAAGATVLDASGCYVDDY
ncbi:hypothetical protein JL722_6602 [Aureococcus anophagefferens]|nr:hypothetical protein JL722_6602 [Aureococcus anophagefferens]